MDRNHWIEIEADYLTDQPADSQDIEPTTAYLFGWRCSRQPTGAIRRSRMFVKVTARGQTQLEERVNSFVNAENLLLIESPRNAKAYECSGREPAVVHWVDVRHTRSEE